MSSRLFSSINEKEILKSLKEMPNGKTPGSDGFTTDFYKFFWINIKGLLFDSYKYAFEHNSLSIEQRRGILCLIPKKQRNKLLLKNWRPITLLNTDYKILAKILSVRLGSVLDKIVHPDQTAYIKGRFIGENIRLIEDVIHYAKLLHKPGILLAIDFEKAFDTLKWSYLQKTLTSFGFGEIFCRWVKILYHNISSSILNNGHLSNAFHPERGIRQGCPLSALLFILAVETFAIEIRNNKNVRGISIGTKQIKISQLADDTTCFVEDIRSAEMVIKTLKCFHFCSGLKVNMEKTEAMYIGSLINTADKPIGVQWTKGPISILGVVFTNNKDEHIKLNFDPKVQAMKDILNIWGQRGLSLKGKITVINVLAISKLIYLANTIHIPDSVIKEVNDAIFKFLWSNKRSKIAKNCIISEIENGGLKMPDFQLKVQALQAAWIRRMIQSKNKSWIELLKYFYKTRDLHMFFASKPVIQTVYDKIPQFYSDILRTWQMLNNIEPTHVMDILNEVLWHNRFITIEQKPMFIQKLYDKGILFVNDLLAEDGQFMDIEQFCTTYDINISFIELLQLKQALPYRWRQALLNNIIRPASKPTVEGKMITIGTKQFDLKKLSSKEIYWLLIDSKKETPKGIQKWVNQFNLTEFHTEYYWIPYRNCRETRIQSLQYRILTRIFPCNKWLNTLKVIESDRCNICEEIDSIEHYLITCKVLKRFWQSFIDWWKYISKQESFTLTDQNIILGIIEYAKWKDVLNFCLLKAKMFIYNKKIHEEEISFHGFLVHIKNSLQTELYIAQQNNQSQKYRNYTFVEANIDL